MNILLCNKYFFLNGGTEKYLSDIMTHLSAQGHTTIPFSVNFDTNWPSPYAGYFLDPPSSPDAAHYRDMEISAASAIRLLDHAIYSTAAKRKLRALLSDTAPVDVAYVLNIYNYMSPSILHTLRTRKIPVVMHVGDYNLLCPNYVFLRDGKPCTLCGKGEYLHGFRYRCVKRSWSASAVRVAAMYVHRWLKIYDSIAAFVVPCDFMKNQMIRGGFPEERVYLIKYPVAVIPDRKGVRKRSHILYFGRISREKGLDSLINAYQRCASRMEPDLVLLGRDYDGETARLQGLIKAEYAHRIHFPGFRTEPELSRWIGEALFTVTPSRWYDNAPLSVYESLACGTPVLGARIGGIPEQIEDGVTGKLFLPDSETDLADGLTWMARQGERLEAMGRSGRDHVLKELSMEKHASGLLSLFDRVTQEHRSG